MSILSDIEAKPAPVLTQDHNGVIVMKFRKRLDGLQGNTAEQFLYAAASDPNVPARGQPSRADPTMYLYERTFTPLPGQSVGGPVPNSVYVDFVYKQGNPYAAFRSSGATSSRQKTNFDKDGNMMYVLCPSAWGTPITGTVDGNAFASIQYVSPSGQNVGNITLVDFQGTTLSNASGPPVQPVEVEIPVAQPYERFERYESPPRFDAGSWVGRVNSTQFLGYAPRTVFLANLRQERHEGATEWKCTYEFQVNLDGYDVTEGYRDPDTGTFAVGDTESDGSIQTFRVLGEKDFGQLQLGNGLGN